MLRWTLFFLLVALAAAIFGFHSLEGVALLIAKVLFFVFLVLFLLSLVVGKRVPPAT
jgi:uncharacterized membrane protein YtjA (UPF0391 family)